MFIIKIPGIDVCVCVFAREMCTGKDIKDDYKK
jgi:hypothetical protein